MELPANTGVLMIPDVTAPDGTKLSDGWSLCSEQAPQPSCLPSSLFTEVQFDSVRLSLNSSLVDGLAQGRFQILTVPYCVHRNKVPNYRRAMAARQLARHCEPNKWSLKQVFDNFTIGRTRASQWFSATPFVNQQLKPTLV